MWRTVDLVLRFIYLVAAPALLTLLASVFPLTGTLVGAGIATVVALIGGDRWHAAVDRVPVLGRVLGGMARLGEFYREHPPKPLVYYIFYPVLLPVILAMKVPRREFTLYRKVNAIALVVIVAGGALDYYRHWQPELGFGLFLGSMFTGFILQLLVMFALVMPIVTTLIMLRLRGQTRTLYGLLAIILACGALGAWASHHRKDAVPFSTWTRLEYRTVTAFRDQARCEARTRERGACIKDNRALAALIEGLDAAEVSLLSHPSDQEAALAAARSRIGMYYKPDETRAFQLYSKDQVLIEYVRNGKQPPLAIGYDYAAKKGLFKLADFPADAKQLLGLR